MPRRSRAIAPRATATASKPWGLSSSRGLGGKEKALLKGRKDLPAEYVRVIVRNGLKAMPSFTPGALSDAELTSIAVYVTR